MKIKINKDNFLESIYIRDAEIEVEVSELEYSKIQNGTPFGANYRYDNGVLALVYLDDEDSLRIRRQNDCFNLIDNKSVLWLNSLSEEQRDELNTWYQAWLNVTDTKVIPIKPAWLN